MEKVSIYQWKQIRVTSFIFFSLTETYYLVVRDLLSFPLSVFFYLERNYAGKRHVLLFSHTEEFNCYPFLLYLAWGLTFLNNSTHHLFIKINKILQPSLKKVHFHSHSVTLSLFKIKWGMSNQHKQLKQLLDKLKTPP